MKKALVIIAVLFLLGASFTSCKTHKPCPAYGSIETEQEVKV